MKLNSPNILVMCHCPEIYTESCGWADRCKFTITVWKTVEAIIQSSITSSLTFSPLFIWCLCFCLSFQPSHLHFALSLTCSLPFLSVHWALKFWQVKDVLFSSTVAQAHTQRPTQTHLQYTRACVSNYVCAARYLCCRPLAEWDKLSGSHFSEWISIVCCCLFMCCYGCVYVRSGCICVSLCCMQGWSCLAMELILTPMITVARFLRVDSHVTTTQLAKGQRRARARDTALSIGVTRHPCCRRRQWLRHCCHQSSPSLCRQTQSVICFFPSSFFFLSSFPPSSNHSFSPCVQLHSLYFNILSSWKCACVYSYSRWMSRCIDFVFVCLTQAHTAGQWACGARLQERMR